MGIAAVTLDDLFADYELTTSKWKKFFEEQPAAADVPTDIAGSGTIGGLVSHIYMAAMRSSERLLGEPLSELKTPRNLAGGWELERTATANLRRFLASSSDASLDGTLSFMTKVAGEVTVTRRKLCLHIFVHAIRHLGADRSSGTAGRLPSGMGAGHFVQQRDQVADGLFGLGCVTSSVLP